MLACLPLSESCLVLGASRAMSECLSAFSFFLSFLALALAIAALLLALDINACKDLRIL